MARSHYPVQSSGFTACLLRGLSTRSEKTPQLKTTRRKEALSPHPQEHWGPGEILKPRPPQQGLFFSSFSSNSSTTTLFSLVTTLFSLASLSSHCYHSLLTIATLFSLPPLSPQALLSVILSQDLFRSFLTSRDSSASDSSSQALSSYQSHSLAYFLWSSSFIPSSRHATRSFSNILPSLRSLCPPGRLRAPISCIETSSY